MADATPCTRCHCLFRGRVQGVGFRFATRNLAINYDVTGFVRNLPDGQVELVAEGPPCEVGDFVQAVEARMRPHIREVHRTDEAATGDYPQFVIGR